MLDIKFIRENADAVQENARRKNYDVNIKELLTLDDSRRELSARADELRERRNANAAKMKGVQGKPDQSIIDEGKLIKTELAELEESLNAVEVEALTLQKKVPNMASADVPVGATEDENVVAKVVGEPTKFDFAPRNHYEIAEQRDWIDKERAAKVAGSRFAYLKGDLVKLQFAIVQFVINSLSDADTIAKIAKEAGLEGIATKPFTPILPPLMIRTELYDAMDRLEPRDDRYKLEDDDLWLQGSAEHVMGSMHANEVLAEAQLPIRYLGYATSFRREAGTYGKDMEGILRMHQFDKLEMESFTVAEDGLKEHLLLVAIQEYLLSQLGLPYRVIQKCTADIGKPNARGIDMEAWLPGQDQYRETHTADYMTDYQARRLQTRVRRETGENAGSLELIHTNDATAFALGRAMIAIIENGQQEDGTVTIPEVLQPYLGGKKFFKLKRSLRIERIIRVSTNQQEEDMIASIDITGIKYNVNDKTEKYVMEKVGKLDRYVPSHARKTIVADVKLRQVDQDHGNKYEAEVILKVPNKTIIAKDTTMNMMAAIDIVEAKLIAQLRKYKDTLVKQKLAASI